MNTAVARLVRTVAISAFCSAACSSSGSKAEHGAPPPHPHERLRRTGGEQGRQQRLRHGGPLGKLHFTATDPGAATIVPDCSGSAGCVPPFTGTSFCMHGTVTGRTDYTGFAMLGWNVNQMDGGAAGTWPIPATGGITVTVSNPSNTPLRLQLQGTDPHSGSDRWCVPLTSGQLTPWTSLVTNCYTGGTPRPRSPPARRSSRPRSWCRACKRICRSH